MSESKTPKKIPLHQMAMAKEVSESFGIPSNQLINLIKLQIIAVPEGEEQATDAELALVLSTIRTTGLNPLMGQIHAWRDWKGKMAIMLGLDGWIDYAKKDPAFLYCTYDYGSLVNSPDGKGKQCYEWMQAIIHDNAGNEIPQPRVYLEEWYVPQRKTPAPWQKQTKHKLFVVTYRLAIRVFCGLVGVVIDEEAEYYRGPQQGEQTDSRVDEMATRLKEINSHPPIKAEYETVDGAHFKSDTDHDYEVVEAEALQEDAMVDAMAGEGTTYGPFPPNYEPQTEGEPSTLPEHGGGRQLPRTVKETPLLDSLQNVCSVPNCASQGMIRCQSCQEWFCMEHLSNNPELCLVCYGGE